MEQEKRAQDGAEGQINSQGLFSAAECLERERVDVVHGMYVQMLCQWVLL